MHVDHLSASSAKLFIDCPAQWKAKYVHGGSETKNPLTDNGSAIHEALENFVKGGWHAASVSLDQKAEQLSHLYGIAFAKFFPHPTPETAGLMLDGVDMLVRWLGRNQDWSDRKVRLIEGAQRFILKTKFGDVPWEYRIDRVDERLSDAAIRVVDYKSGRWEVSQEDMRDEIQVKSYAVAASEMFPGRPRYSVAFDYLRSGHGEKGVIFTLEQIEEVRAELVALAEAVIESDGLTERINSNCRFCTRRFECKSLRAHEAGGGFHGYTPEALVDLRVRLGHRQTAIGAMVKQIDEEIKGLLKAEDAPEVLPGTGTEGVTLKSQRRRAVEPTLLLGTRPVENLMAHGAKLSMSVDALQKMIKQETTPEGKAELQKAIVMTSTAPSIQIVTVKK